MMALFAFVHQVFDGGNHAVTSACSKIDPSSLPTPFPAHSIGIL